MKLKKNEIKTLKLLLQNPETTFKSLAQKANLNEVSIRRICSRLKEKKLFCQINIPNFAKLGYIYLIIQKVKNISNEEKNKLQQQKNFLDLKETIDNKTVIRTVWKSLQDFQNHRKQFSFEEESLDIISLQEDEEFIHTNIL